MSVVIKGDFQCSVHLLRSPCPDQSFPSLSHRRHVFGLCMLYKVNSNSNIIIVCSVRIHLLLLDFDIPKLLLVIIHLRLECQDVERLNFQNVYSRPNFVCGMTFTAMCLTPARCMILRKQSTVVASLSCIFISFQFRRCLWGCESN